MISCWWYPEDHVLPTQICVRVLKRKNILAGEAFNVCNHQVKVNLMLGLHVWRQSDDRYVT